MQQRKTLSSQFEQQWRDSIPSFIQGFTESEYLVFENLFEMFADLRESVAYSYPVKMPTLEYTCTQSVKMCRIKKSERLCKELVIERFRSVLNSFGIPEGRPNRYSYRRKLRVMGCEMFMFMRENSQSLASLCQTEKLYSSAETKTG